MDAGGGSRHGRARAQAHRLADRRRQRGESECAADQRRRAVPRRGHENAVRRADDLCRGAVAVRPGGCRGTQHLARVRPERLDENCLRATRGLRRASLLGGRLTEVDGVAVKAHAGGGGGGEPVNRPGRRDHDPVAAKRDHLARRCAERRARKQRDDDQRRQQNRPSGDGATDGGWSTRGKGHGQYGRTRSSLRRTPDNGAWRTERCKIGTRQDRWRPSGLVCLSLISGVR
jgi:hypothetical protein